MVTHVFYNSNLSQEIFAIDTWGAVICSLGHGRKHMLMIFRLYGDQALYCCNGRKHRCKHVSDSVPSSFDTSEHFDYNIASLTGIVLNCSASFSWNDPSHH